MKISGFTMVRNADKFHFPIKESILSILPIVDEFVVALGDCDKDDNTKEIINSLNSEKLKIFERKWDEKYFSNGSIFAVETNFALSKCTGDWCFYLQADEIVHENDLKRIVNYCKTYLDHKEVDGLLFKYYHFFGDSNHYLPYHGWYKNEIRIIRNDSYIYSFGDAQSFRKNNNEKLNVVEINAHIYHYGWVRPPQLMQLKKKEQDSMHQGINETYKNYKSKQIIFDYGALGKLPLFKGKHPKIMNRYIEKINWKSQLNYSKKANLNRTRMKHERIVYRLLTLIENIIFNGKEIFGYSNWKKL